MIKIGVIIDTPTPNTFIFKVFNEFENSITIGTFILCEDNGNLVISRVAKVYRRNYLMDDRLISQINNDSSIEILKDYGIDISQLSHTTLAKGVVVGMLRSGKLEKLRRPLKILSYVYLPTEKEIEQFLHTSKNDIYIEVGTVKGFSKVKAYINADKLVTHHCAILAATGAGKSWLAGVIIEELVLKANIPIIVIDPHSEYSTMQIPANKLGVELSLEEKKLAEEIASKVEVYVPARVNTYAIDSYFRKKFGVERRYERFGINPKSIPLSMLIKLLNHYYGLTDTQRRILEEGWQYMISMSSTDELVSIDELIQEVISYGKHVAPKGYAGELAITSLISKLKVFFENRPFFILRPGEYYGDKPIRLLNLRDILSRPGVKVFDLGGLDIIDQQALVTIILDTVLNLAIKRLIPPTFIVIEEAHNFAPSKGDALSLNSILKIAREGRKFGVGLCIISQRPTRIHPDVLSQCMTQIFKRIINPNDLKYVKQVVESTSIEDLWEVKVLSEDEALITGIAVPIPLPIKVKKRLTAHGGLTPSLKFYLTLDQEL